MQEIIKINKNCCLYPNTNIFYKMLSPKTIKTRNIFNSNISKSHWKPFHIPRTIDKIKNNISLIV